MSSSLAPIAIHVDHRVTDYDAWKKVFDDHQSERIQASILGHFVHRVVDDPNWIYVYCLAACAEKAQAFVKSAEVAEVMQNAGVEGMPTIRLMTPKSTDFTPDHNRPGAIIVHSVEDYAAWRAAYDAFDDFRNQSGIVGHAVSQAFEDPNRVIIYHQANEIQSLRSFIDSNELKQAMQTAGAIGPVDIRFVEPVDFATY